MIRPKEKDYTSQVAYTRALEAYCDSLPQLAQYSDIVSDGGMDPRNKFDKPAQQEPAGLFKWLPEGATHIGRISVRTAAGGSLEMTTHAFKYDSAVLKVYVTDNDNEYPGWRDAKDCFFHLNFPVLPLYTSPPAQRTWVSLTDEEMRLIDPDGFEDNLPQMIQQALKEKNT